MSNIDDFMDMPEFSKCSGEDGPTKLFRHLSLRQLTKLNKMQLAQRKTRCQEMMAYCDKRINDHMDCEGNVCSNHRYKAAQRYNRAKEQLRKIELVESWR